MNRIRFILKELQRCFGTALLPIVAFLGYISLRSSTVLEDGLHEFNGAYHPAYFGWYDVVLAYAIIFSFTTGALKLELKDLIFGVVGLFIISASWINTYEADRMFIWSGLICFFRFYLVFIFAKSLVRKLGYLTAEKVLLLVYGLLMLSAIFWYSMQFGEQNRMAASAMTSASFGQVSAVMCLLFYARKRYFGLFLSFLFLLLSFSRTSLLVFLVLIVIQNRRLIPLNLIKYVVALALLGMLSIAVFQHYGGVESQVVLESRFSMKEISNLNGRSDLWSYAIEMIRRHEIPFAGVGFHMTPSLIAENNIKFLRSYDIGHYVPPHYHNILIEYTLSLGIFAWAIFFAIVKRIWQAFQRNCDQAFFIYAFFFLSQIMDYTIFPPKEIIIFALMLGMAEGQLLNDGLKSRQPDKQTEAQAAITQAEKVGTVV